ncbi:hypothetical protein BpHYR1_018894 [Brachionus plicatilis]|uniref:Uncharacterized protein n=1 Tax=Brachionus plicatilis TaxID=10195 RepID=A0A3M7R109_BRAPC|nr:hypothetical protein BpHYR1_018894 [Brachionus plicatilis]
MYCFGCLNRLRKGILNKNCSKWWFVTKEKIHILLSRTNFKRYAFKISMIKTFSNFQTLLNEDSKPPNFLTYSCFSHKECGNELSSFLNT